MPDLPDFDTLVFKLTAAWCLALAYLAVVLSCGCVVTYVVKWCFAKATNTVVNPNFLLNCMKSIRYFMYICCIVAVCFIAVCIFVVVGFHAIDYAFQIIF